MDTDKAVAGMLELHWEQLPNGRVVYAVFSHLQNGQLRLESSMEQGPFDTALEVSQWAWRAISRLVPPSSC
jgi:hypothetical protein